MNVLYQPKSAMSNVLPVGNPITGQFHIMGHRASGGPAMMWKIFDGIQKSTKQEASVFVFEKKSMEQFTRREHDLILEALKKGVSQLTRLRHPKILSVLHPLEDSRESLAFATEPVFASLANVIGQHDNLPHPAPAYLKDFSLFDVEIKYGLLQVLEGLGFLHSNVKMVHANLCPESIFINKIGCWKMAGFDFCINNANQQGPAYFPFREWEVNVTPSAQPKLNYLAPEYAVTATCDTASDMYSIGILIYAIHNGGKPVFESMADWNAFKKNIDELRNLRMSRLDGLPEQVKGHVKMLLNIEPTLRPDADQLSKIPFFEDVGAMTLTYLDLLVQKDNLQKSQFFKGLPKIVAELPKRVNLQRVLPSLSKECANANLVPFILPNMIAIAEQATDEEYCQQIFPEFIPLFKITEPIQVMHIFLQNMNLLLSKTSQDNISNHILPMITQAVETGEPELQELIVNVLPRFADFDEYTSLKNTISSIIKDPNVSPGDDSDEDSSNENDDEDDGDDAHCEDYSLEVVGPCHEALLEDFGLLQGYCPQAQMDEIPLLDEAEVTFPLSTDFLEDDLARAWQLVPKVPVIVKLHLSYAKYFEDKRAARVEVFQEKLEKRRAGVLIQMQGPPEPKVPRLSISDTNEDHMQNQKQGLLLKMVNYAQQRLHTLNDHCLICDEPHGANKAVMLKPTVCDRDLCILAYLKCGAHAFLIDHEADSGSVEIESELEVVDLLIAMAKAAAVSSRYDVIFDPYPTVVNPENAQEFVFAAENKQTIEQVRQVLMTIPPMDELKQMQESELKMKLDAAHVLAYPLLQWITSSNRSHIVPLKTDQRLSFMKTDYQFLLLSSPPAKEAIFKRAKDVHGSIFAFHGSSIENWHSIIRRGLVCASGSPLERNGAVYGKGIYVSPAASVSFSYSSGRQSLPTGQGYAGSSLHMVHPKNVVCMALCEVVNSKDLQKATETIWVMPEEDYVVTRFLFVDAEQRKSAARSDDHTILAEIRKALE